MTARGTQTTAPTQATLITRISHRSGRTRPHCEHTLPLSDPPNRADRHRIWYAETMGFPATHCGRPAYFTVRSVYMCEAHAGQAALRLLLRD